MFKFLWQRDKEMQSLAEIIAVDMEKLNLSKLAIEKAVMMIAKAIAKSDILIQTESKEKNKQEYRLNIQPNDHECGTVFWTEVVRQLLTVQEVLIIPLGGKYYLASAWNVSNNVLTERTYSNITLTCAGYDYPIWKKKRSSEVIHLKYDSLIGQQVQGTINGVKAQLRAQSSIAKKQTVRAVLFEDLDPDSPTFGAMCLGTLGFEIASERTADGRDWKWSTFGTGQGFFADFIVAGTMLADRIKGGTLELGGAGNGNGVAKVLNADGNEIVRLDKDGVYAKGKYVCANTDGSQTATLSNGKLTFKTESYEVVIRAGAIGGLTGLMIYPEQGAVRTKFLSIGDKLSARFDNISLLASGKTTIGGASLEVQRDGKGYSGKTGKAVFSDGTYLEYVNGFLVGGNTKEGGF